MIHNTKSKSHKKLVAFLLFIVLLIFGIFIYSHLNKLQAKQEAKENININGLFLAKPTSIEPFKLTDSQGVNFTNANLKNHWTLLFFGFTNCGYVCPTTMAALKNMYSLLQKEMPAKDLPQVLLVTVDPDRDTVDKLKAYVTSFNPTFLGARTNIEDTKALEKEFHVVAVKMQGADKKSYSFNHTAEIMLINPQAQLQAFLSFPPNAEQLSKDYQLILKTVEN